ncbi:hypothetical protein JCM5350_004764 [Sporobolomyces pararoseus]
MSNLLPLPFKRTEPVNLSTSLISYITNSPTSSTHPSLIKRDCDRLEQLRREIYGENGEILVMQSTVDKLLTYQAQLSLTFNKFPDNAGPNFVYYSIFPSTTSTSTLTPTPTLPPGSLPSESLHPPSPPPRSGIPSLSYEYLSTLYNLSALYTHLALSNQQHRATNSSDRDGGESLKISINYLQSSLGTLQKLISFLPIYQKQQQLSSSQGRGGGDVDFEEEVLKGFESFLKSCIQEIGWMKSVLDRLKNGTISKLALQVSLNYSEALSNFPNDYLPIEWKQFLKLKQKHFEAVSQYRKSLDDLGSNRYGDEIGRLTYSVEILKSTLSEIKLSKYKSITVGGSGNVLESVVKDSKAFLKVLEDNLKRANKDNDLIYLSSPTPYSSLPPTTPFSLTRSTPPPLVTNPRTHLRDEAKVFEMLDKREIGEVLEVWKDRKLVWEEEKQNWNKEEDKVLRMTLESLNLPASLEEEQDEEDSDNIDISSSSSSLKKKKLANPTTIPQNLLDQSQEIINLGGLKRLETLFKDVRKLSQLNRELLNETNQYLQQPHSTSSNNDDHATQLLERLNYFSQLLTQATESDQTVRSKFSNYSIEQTISILEGGRESILAALPPPPPPSSSSLSEREGGGNRKRRSEEERLEIRKLKRFIKRCLEEIEDIRLERNELVNVRIKRVLEDWEIRDQVVLKSNQLEQTTLLDNEAEAEGGAGGGSLEMFEEVLVGEMNKIEKLFQQDFKRIEMEQKNLIDQLKTLNTKFQSLKTPPSSNPLHSQEIDSPTTTTTVLSARQEQLQSFSLAHERYLEILNNLKEGLKFYNDLNKLVGELRDSSKQFAYSRSIELQQRQQSQTIHESQQPISASSHEEDAAEEHDFIVDDDPISKKLSQPISLPPSSSSTSRSSRTKVAEVETSRRSSRRTATTAGNATPSERDSRSGNNARETAQSGTKGGGGGAGGGGWDPSMGIRFG